MNRPAAPQDARTVQVRVQVIEMEPFALDLVVPTYLPASDLTQRIARDAGLGAYWDDGTRRKFWLRARGRVMQDHERLDELGVIQYELVHLLPQPPPGTGVQERPPEYPKNKGYAAAGWGPTLSGLALVGSLSVAWSIGLLANHGLLMSVLPPIALALLGTSLARHLLGGQGSDIKVPLLGAGISFPLWLLALVPAMLTIEIDALTIALLVLPSVVGLLIGVTIAWLAWYGAVEPLPKVTHAEVVMQEQVAVYNCGICGLDVQPDVRTSCKYACGRIFHVGCLTARESVHTGDGCAVCGFIPA